nr:MAG TPA: hypothetical protein [Caudoviricetes sp.]
MYEYHGNKGSRRQQEIKEPLTLYRAGGFLFISCRRYQTDHLQIYSGGVRILNVQLVITGTLSIACLIGASSVNAKRNAALATAYTLSESALKDYQGKVVEMFGEKKHETVKDAIAKDKIEKNPVVTREIIITEKGNTLCYDAISGRYFKGDIDKIKKAECELNRRMRDEMYVSLNDFYYEVGLDNIKIGDELGWNIDNGYIDLSFSSQLTSDGTPCLVIDYSIAPRYNFSELM